MHNRRTTPDEIPASVAPYLSASDRPRDDPPRLFTSLQGSDQPDRVEMHNPHTYYHYKSIYSNFFNEGRNL